MVALLLAVLYCCFMSLGLPDSVLGSSWPALRDSFAGGRLPEYVLSGIQFVINAFTVISSFSSHWIIKRIGIRWVCFISILLTVIGLYGFALVQDAWWVFFVLALPLGLGAGAIDSGLNNYVATHFKPKNINWLDGFWSLGAAFSPFLMFLALGTDGTNWRLGFIIVASVQALVLLFVAATWKVWPLAERKQGLKLKVVLNKANAMAQAKAEKEDGVGIFKALTIKGVIPAMLCFFFYSSINQTLTLWIATYGRDSFSGTLDDAQASLLVSLLLFTDMSGRFLSGFLSIKFSEKSLIRVGEIILAMGVILLLLPNSIGVWKLYVSVFLMGLGISPIYASMVARTPLVFGSDASQAIMGLEMGTSALSSAIMPPLFGLIANATNISALPYYVGVSLLLNFLFSEIVNNSRPKTTVKKKLKHSY